MDLGAMKLEDYSEKKIHKVSNPRPKGPKMSVKDALSGERWT
jgi:hypothetical protein